MQDTQESESGSFAQGQITLLHAPADRQRVEEELLPLFASHDVRPLAYHTEAPPDLPEGARVAAYLEDALLPSLLTRAAAHGYRLGILPHPKMQHGAPVFGVSPHPEKAVAELLGCEREISFDLLYCNGQPVLHSVVIGDASPILAGNERPERLGARLRRFARLLRSTPSMSLRFFELSTRAGHKLETAALGIVAVEHGSSSVLSRRLLEGTDVKNGMLHALVVSPRSLSDVVAYLAKALLPAERRGIRLPPFVGHIKTASLTVKSHSPIPFSLDGNIRSASEIHLSVEPRVLRLAPGHHLRAAQAAPEPKEAFQVRSLPVGDACHELEGRPLPLRRHATTEEFKELFVLLREGARASRSYLILMVLSTLLATLGLFSGSGPVIIGAMILAPLMAPIISLSMGTLRQDQPLITASAKTLALGILLGLACATLLTWALPLRNLNLEIAARQNPTLLDLGVAVVAGVAGAYAHARSEVARSLAGVAIAVALVPPLAVIGIGLGWRNISIFTGASLLFLTNLGGMVLAAAITFLVLGYSPLRRAKQGLMISLVFVATVSVPLALGFRAMVMEHGAVRALDGFQVDGVMLRNVSVRRAAPTYVSVRLISPEPLDLGQIDQVKEAVEARLGREIRLEATVAVVR